MDANSTLKSVQQSLLLSSVPFPLVTDDRRRTYEAVTRNGGVRSYPRSCLHSLVQAQHPGDVGTSQCGGIQYVVQKSVGDEDPKVHQDHNAYVGSVSAIINEALQKRLIAGECSGCIIDQFARRVPIANQTLCGPITAPTQLCEQTSDTLERIEPATLLALHTVTDPWNDITQFQSLLKLTQTILGCQLEGTRYESISPQSVQPQELAERCGTPGVNYCGPKNSRLNAALQTLKVPACLNEACCEHDKCYKDNCIEKKCYWTPQTQLCDKSLLDACTGRGSCPFATIFTHHVARFICTVVVCFTGPSINPSCNVVPRPECNQPPFPEPCDPTACSPACLFDSQRCCGGVCVPDDYHCCPNGSNCIPQLECRYLTDAGTWGCDCPPPGPPCLQWGSRSICRKMYGKRTGLKHYFWSRSIARVALH